VKESSIVPASGSTASSSHPSSIAAGGGSRRPSITSQKGPWRSPPALTSVLATAHSIWDVRLRWLSRQLRTRRPHSRRGPRHRGSIGQQQLFTVTQSWRSARRVCADVGSIIRGEASDIVASTHGNVRKRSCTTNLFPAFSRENCRVPCTRELEQLRRLGCELRRSTSSPVDTPYKHRYDGRLLEVGGVRCTGSAREDIS
jgi:hypothetical protein